MNRALLLLVGVLVAVSGCGDGMDDPDAGDSGEIPGEDGGEDAGDEPDTGEACGNGVVDVGEDCEPGDVDGETCASQGFDGGTLACNADCTFDTAACDECGDGEVTGD